MARLTRAESQAQTRQRLIEAAAIVFARRGFHGASIDEVADEAGYTKGAVYSNFGSKDELFLAVLEARLQTNADFYRRLDQRAQAQPGQDLAGLLPRLDDLEETWCLLQVEFWLYALRNPPLRDRMAALYRRYRAQLASITQRAASAEIESEEVAAVAIALYHALTLQWHADPGVFRPDLISRVLRALGQAAAATDGHRAVRRRAWKAGARPPDTDPDHGTVGSRTHQATRSDSS
jgi:AcrR family transcriptional regulator